MENFQKNLSNIKVILVILFIIQIIIIGILFWIKNPQQVLDNLNVVNIINDANSLATKSGQPTPPNETPQIAQINDKKNLESAETLRKQNKINEEVYKDSKDGDYVLVYSSKMLIYRADEKKLIYNGQTPAMRLKTAQETLLSLAVKKGKEDGLVPNDNNSTPTVSIITDPDKTKATGAFYEKVQKDDLVVQYTDLNLVYIYRPSDNSIVNKGKYELK